uniref:Uncharacterized protein n=1 Tax=Rhizophora mucronata TaxID=61149 RepID=A0A2P2MZZ4_RHIMU
MFKALNRRPITAVHVSVPLWDDGYPDDNIDPLTHADMFLNCPRFMDPWFSCFKKSF